MTAHSIAIARLRQTGPRDIAGRMGVARPGAGFILLRTGTYADRMRRRRVR